jgi:hypothetical protein
MGWQYLGQDRRMSIWAECILFRIGNVRECTGCILVRIWVWVYGLAVSRSRSGYVHKSWQYLDQDMGVSIWAG